MTHSVKISADKLISTESFKRFIKSVREFCDFIENDAEGALSFLLSAESRLQNLYIGGRALPVIDLNHNADFDDRMNKAEFEKRLNFIAERLGNNRFYWHVFDPTKEEDIEAVCGDLLDDFGDIYKDLKNSLLLFDTGTSAEIESAAWTFKWSFDNHWSDHCINATYALHYFIQHAV
jgi:hypothetical protein